MARAQRAKQDPDRLLTLEQIEAELTKLSARTKVLKELKRARVVEAAGPRARKVSDEKIWQMYDEAVGAAGGHTWGVISQMEGELPISSKSIHRALNRRKKVGH